MAPDAVHGLHIIAMIAWRCGAEISVQCQGPPFDAGIV
jgi:hypothetical protein